MVDWNELFWATTTCELERKQEYWFEGKRCSLDFMFPCLFMISKCNVQRKRKSHEGCTDKANATVKCKREGELKETQERGRAKRKYMHCAKAKKFMYFDSKQHHF